MTDMPEPVASPFSRSGILPGYGWDADLLNPEADEPFLANWVTPVSDDPLTTGAIDQAQQQWEHLFPDADERDREMFMAGVAAMLLWWSHQSIQTHNEFMSDPANHNDIMYVKVEAVDEFIGRTAARIITTLFLIDDDDKADLDDAFSDVIEGL